MASFPPSPRKPPSKIHIVGAGLHGASLAYFLTKMGHKDVNVIERVSVACAASGKGGGFLARDWGDGPTVPLHQESFHLHSLLAKELGIDSYRKIPVLSVSPGKRGNSKTGICGWLDGEVSSASVMDESGGAQVDPYELATKLMQEAERMGAKLVIGTVEDVVLERVSGTLEQVTSLIVDGQEVKTNAVIVTMGPWASLAEKWFHLPIPITGIKSTSLLYEKVNHEESWKTLVEMEPFALFCEEYNKFHTHLEVYPRKNGEVYLCGVGGSEHVSPSRLQAGEYPPAEVHADEDRVVAAHSAFMEMSPRLGSQLRVKQSQACMRPCPPDGLPLMGKIGHVRGAYISAGHNCWGILWAPSSGKAMAELILQGQSELDLSAFSPHRFQSRSPSKERRGRHQGVAEVGEQW